MNVTFNNFIAVYNNVYPQGFCDFLISAEEKARKLNLLYNRQDAENVPRHRKDDHNFDGFKYYLDAMPVDSTFQGQFVPNIFIHHFREALDIYLDKYSVLRNYSYTIEGMKHQIISSGGGYHVWHYERGPAPSINRRVLTYILYLNTLPVENNGDTEFLYQELKLQPVENQLVIFPADFTHPHRGNPVYKGGVKHIITGWVSYE